MAIWKSAEVESILGVPLEASALTEAVLQQLIDSSSPESEQVEFKGQSYDKRPASADGWTVEQEFVKDVSALANHRGGVLVLGLAEKAGVASALRPLASTTADKEEQRLRAAMNNYMAPLGVVDFVPVAVGSDGFALVVVVPPSIRAPHAVMTKPGADNRRPLRYPVRHGTDTRWLEESEVAERYVRRLRAAELELERLSRVEAEGFRALSLATGLWFFVAIVPEIAAIERIDRKTVFATQNWLDNQQIMSLFEQSLFSGLRPLAAPGRTILGRQFESIDPTMAPSDAHLELHADGSAFVAVAVPGPPGDPAARTRNVIGLQETTGELIPMIDIAGRWVVHQAAVPGTARLSAGIYDASTSDGKFGVPVELHSTSGLNQFGKTPNTRQLVGVQPRVEAVFDLTGPTNVQRSVAVASMVLDSLFQWFGLADCPFLGRDGSIILGPWRHDAQQYARRWADRHGVAISS